MAGRSRAQIPVLTVNAIVLVLLAADSLNPGTSAPTSAAGTTFYVSPTGNDSASGSSSAPRRTIQKAADTLNAGQTAIVAAGNYRERVSITRSGTQASPITLQAASGSTPQMLGFDISGNSWQVSEFDISTQTNGNDGFGIYLSGTASYVTLQTNYIHELCHEGIFMDSGVTHISVLNNRIWRAEMSGVQADGMYDLLQGNEVWGTQHYPANAGGIYAGCTIGGGADFHLRSDSALKSAGVPLPRVTDDFYGNSRGTTAYSVGAAK